MCEDFREEASDAFLCAVHSCWFVFNPRTFKFHCAHNEHQSRQQRIQGASSAACDATRSASSCNLQAFIEQLSSQLSSDVARLIKELKSQADEAIREAEKFDKIRSDFSGTIQKIEVKPAPASLLRCICRRDFLVL